MLPLLIVIFVVVPIVELAVIIQIGQLIGVLPTIALLLIDSIVGSLLLRAQGRAAWERFNRALAERRPPAREVLDGVLVIFGGALLITPGFVTDVLGLLLLLPPTRALLRGVAARRVLPRLIYSTVGGRRVYGRPTSADGPDYDVDGSASDVDSPRLK
jgi:UPF0716 protein FxsA